GAASLERAGQIRRLRSNMQAAAHPQPFEGLLLLESFAHLPQHGHVVFSPVDALAPRGCERHVRIISLDPGHPPVLPFRRPRRSAMPAAFVPARPVVTRGGEYYIARIVWYVTRA